MTKPIHSHLTQLERFKQATASNIKPAFRLVLEQNQYGSGLRANIKQGDVTLNSWTTNGIPVELAHFMTTYRYFDSSQRYFLLFQQLTDGKFPIIFRGTDGTEKEMVFQKDLPCQAGITFNISGNNVYISRTMADGTALLSDSIIKGELLYNPAAGTISHISESMAWETWETVFEELDGEDDEWDEDENWDKEWEGNFEDDDEYGYLNNKNIKRDRHTISVSLDLFNNALLKFSPNVLDKLKGHFFFQLNGIEQPEQKICQQKYLVDIPRGLGDATVSLQTLSLYDGKPYIFSKSTFAIFNKNERLSLPSPLRTKKRVKVIIEAAFKLLDETKQTEHNKTIRSVTTSPDFLKREVRQECKKLLQALEVVWKRSDYILVATVNGWHFVHNDILAQTKVMRILYDMFGVEAFDNGSFVGELIVPTPKLIQLLPELMNRLQKDGFSLQVGTSTVANGKFEFSLDATHSSQDWFELKPEIRCNGELLTAEELHRLFEAGMLNKNGNLMLLDDMAAQMLAMFSGSMPSIKKKKKGEQEYVRVPRLQILDWLSMKSIGVKIKLSPEDEQLMENLINFSSIPQRSIPSTINAVLRHYQLDAWHWLAFLYEHHFGACLADDMGLGKTLQGLTLLAGIMSGELSTAAGTSPHLVVAPPSLLFNWEAEIARFLPNAKVLLYTGTNRSTADFCNYDIIITSYGIVQRDSAILMNLTFNVLIFDEAQTVKNLQAATTNAVRKLRGAFTLALTGTPVENHLGEYFAILDLCLPGLLGTRDEFSRKISKDGSAATARLIGRTRPFVLRRTKELIADELPPKIEIDIPLELNIKQRALYQRTVEEVRDLVKDAYASHAVAQARIIALTAILRLRQICLAPALAVPGASAVSPKLDFLLEQLIELGEEGHSALVFSQFTGYLDLIEKGLKAQGISYYRLDGSTPIPKRKKLVQAFQNGTESSVFLISLKAGGKGLNLTRATYVYHLDPWWNPAVENQASDRAHRIGQTKQVTITRLIMKHTIEEKMMALKEQKTELYRAILEDGAGGGGTSLTRDDFDFLLGG